MSAPIRLSLAQCSELAAKADAQTLVKHFDFAKAAGPSTTEEAVALCRWRVPKVSPEGTCSRPDDLMPEPFDLLHAIYGKKLDETPLDDLLLRRIAVLKVIVMELVEATGADWVGVYRLIKEHPAAPSPRCLVKEAYHGAPSRPFFPLTAEFAAHSNNSNVAMKKEACIIEDTRSLDPDEPYYICDGKVRSELCAPIVDPASGECIGIIDAESFKPKHFGAFFAAESGDDEATMRTAAVLLACQKLGEAKLFADVTALPLP